jgi:hypothetical protein
MRNLVKVKFCGAIKTESVVNIDTKFKKTKSYAFADLILGSIKVNISR